MKSKFRITANIAATIISKFAVVSLFLGSLIQAHAQSDIVAISFNGVVLRIDASSGNSFGVGNSGIMGLNALARNSAGIIYGAGGGGAFVVTNLVAIDPNTGSASIVTPLNFGSEEISIRGLAFSPNNVLYAINNGGGGTAVDVTDKMYIIDLNTGMATLVGDTGVFGIQGLAFSPSGILFGWDVDNGTGGGFGSGLVTVNPLTGIAVDVNPAIGGTAEDIQGLAFAPDGTLYGAHRKLFTVDVSTGAPTLIGGNYSDVRGIEVVPEPSTYALFALSCLAFLISRLKSKRSKSRAEMCG